MMDNDPLLQKADALMQRHRSAAGSSGDDVPVLTEIVGADAIAAAATGNGASVDPATVEKLVQQRLDQLLPILRRELAQELDAWFDEQLPKIVTSLLDGFTDRLVGQISAQARGDLMTWLQTAGENLKSAPPRS
jgi:hypothetical protein